MDVASWGKALLLQLPNAPDRLQRRLMAKQQRTWEFDLEEGMLDAARLTRVIIDPSNPLSYKIEKDMKFRDTVVTLLLDNSGSMRGRRAWPKRWGWLPAGSPSAAKCAPRPEAGRVGAQAP